MSEFLTIIVPVYKIKEDYLRRCIDSLLDQERNDYKIILVDDGSPDQCGAVCDEYAKKSPLISVIHQENQGVSVARNNAIKATTTEWLSFVDADDWVEKDYISTLYRELNENAFDADIAMYEYSREFKSGRHEESLKINTGYLDSTMLNIVRQSTFYKLVINGKENPYTVIAIWDKVYRTSFLKNDNLWFVPEARKGQDRLFNADALNSTSKIYYIGKQLYRYRCWEESRTNRYDNNIPRLTEIEISSLYKIIEKHHLRQMAKEYLNCRICTRLYTCMRLYYFHENNTKPLKVKLQEVRKLVESEPYCEALKTVKLSFLNIQEKVFVVCMKAKMFRVVYFLVKAKSGRTKKKLS